MSILSRFRGRLLRAAGITLVAAPIASACTTEVIVEDDEQDGAGGTTSNGSSGNGSTGNGSTGNGSSANGSSVGSGQSVSSGSTSSGVVTVGATSGQGGASTTATGAGGATMTVITCFMANGSPCADLSSAPTVYGVCTEDDFLWIEEWVSGPFNMNGECCYEVVVSDFCGVGRPYTDHDRALVAPPCKSDAWLGVEAGSIDVSAEDRELLARAWTRDGLFEHASVASFARFALELLAVGAPPDLVADAHRAALDEVKHAGLCFSLASRYGGEAVGPGPLPLTSETRTDLASIAAACVREGCIGETLAALVAAEQLRHASDPRVREALAIIAEDEARHAELAWRVVAWALKSGDATVRARVGEAFAEASQHLLPAAGNADDALAAHGLLSDEHSRQIQLRALTEVVMPCATALLRA